MPDIKPEDKSFKIIGTSVPRVDGFDKVTGRAKYGADYNRRGQLYGAVKYTEFPHAKIISIDIEKAKEISGVRAVLTHKDIPGNKSFGAIEPHQMILCTDKARFFGDVVAIVAAETLKSPRKLSNRLKSDMNRCR